MITYFKEWNFTNKITFFASLLLISPSIKTMASREALPTNLQNYAPAMVAKDGHLEPQQGQDFDKMMHELESAAQEIDQFVKTLPEEDQKEFNRVVQEVEKKMSDTDPAVLERFLSNQMTPDELNAFLGDVFSDITPPEIKEPEAQELPVVEEPKKEQKKPVVTTKELTKQEQALALIETIIKKTQSFLVKTQSMPELAGKVKRWGKSGILYDWQASFEWSTVKTAIEQLNIKLNKLIEKDPQNQKYKHLDDVIADEVLYNNLSKLKATLNEYESQIEVTSFGMNKMNKQVKTALQRTISAFTEAVYRFKVPESLDKIFTKYEPRAKELRAKEESAEKKAALAAKNPRRPTYTVVGGTPESESDYFVPSYGSDTSSGYYGGGGYSPSYGGSSYTPSYQPTEAPSAGGSSGSSSRSGGRPGEKKEDKEGKEDKGKKEDKSDKSEAKDNEKSKEAGKPETKKSEKPAEDSEIKEIKKILEKAGKEFNEKKLTKLVETLKDPADEQTIIDTDLSLGKVVRQLNKTTDHIKALKLKTASRQQHNKAWYQKQLQKMRDDLKIDGASLKKTFDTFIGKIDELEKAGPQVLKDTVPAASKRYAYFGERQEEPAAAIPPVIAEEEEGVPAGGVPVELPAERPIDPQLQYVRNNLHHPTTVYELRDAIKTLNQTIDTFLQAPLSRVKPAAPVGPRRAP